MTKKNSTKRALVASILVLCMCFTMLIGTTFAWFTDSATSSGNVIKTGTLNVGMYWADGTKAVPTSDADWTDATSGAIFNNENWEPGYAEVRHVKIANEGSLALKYKVQIIANGEVSKLAEVIDVYYVDPAEPFATGDDLTDENKLGTLADALANIGDTGTGFLLANEAHTVTLALKMRENAGNEYQGIGIGANFSVQVLATQLTSEFDSFGNQYDADADYSAKVSNFEELSMALKKSGNVTLTNDIVINSSDLINDPNLASMPIGLAIVGTDTTIDLNGNDIVINAQDGAAIHVKDGTLNITGEGTISNTGTSGYVVWAKGASTVNVQDGAFFAGGDDTTLFYASGTVAFDANSDWATINIYGGTFTNEAVGDSVQDYLNVMNHGVGRINIYGGTFDFDPANTNWGDDAAYIRVAPTYEVVDNNDGTYTVVRSSVVNFTEDLNEEVVVNKEDEITLNLGGQALNNTLTNSGDVTVNGGEINVSGNNALYNEGEAELKDVTINMTNNSGYITNSRTEGSVTVYENVTATSSGGGVNVWEGEAVFKSGTIVTNSTTTNPRHMFYVANGATLTIEDGEFFFNPNNLTRKGSYICAVANSTVIINGGTFHKPSTRTAPIQCDGTSNVIIYGGTFAFDPTPYVADGYVAIENNGWWTVQKA